MPHGDIAINTMKQLCDRGIDVSILLGQAERS